ncbi:MAG: protein kinase, partial [Chloroflexota bacterium]
MISLAGYQVKEALYESNQSIIYRGLRTVDQQPVILKLLNRDYPTQAEITQFKREYEIVKDLNLAGVTQSYHLERHGNSSIIIMEDLGGQALSSFIPTWQFDLTNFLKLAIQITGAIDEIHQKNIIHKDINPSNIIYNPATNQVKLIDFGISTILARENTSPQNPNILEGTLAYISPEQTGRVNRSIDYRTDFYSLGVTLYELLTGQLPFTTKDALALVHAHIAKHPIAPHEINPQIPVVVSNIVTKLLSKTVEERYQSAYGLKRDLEEVLIQWQKQGSITTFPLARYDISNKFQIPQKLYGREEELSLLLETFDKVSLGSREMFLVSGDSGIGKSALIHEIHKPLLARQGYFVTGKFDQFKRDTPYTSLIQAFQDLMRQV